MRMCSRGLYFLVVCALCSAEQTINAFAPPTNSIIHRQVRHHIVGASLQTTTYQQLNIINGRIKQSSTVSRRRIRQSSTQLYDILLHTTKSVVETAAAASEGVVLADYAPQAADLFSNMKLPAAVVTAGMISLGFATRFPELPRDSLDKVYPLEVRQRVAKLDRLHIVLGLISVTSMLIVVLWAAVEVNQLTERSYLPAYSVWGESIISYTQHINMHINLQLILLCVFFSKMKYSQLYTIIITYTQNANHVKNIKQYTRFNTSGL